MTSRTFTEAAHACFALIGKNKTQKEMFEMSAGFIFAGSMLVEQLGGRELAAEQLYAMADALAVPLEKNESLRLKPKKT